jgi:hypothetical protein
MVRSVRVVNLLALIAALGWLVSRPGWEPLATSLGLLGAFLAQISHRVEPWKLQADRALFTKLQLLLPPDRIRFIADYDFRAAFRLEWVEPLFLFVEAWVGPEHDFHDKTLQGLKQQLLEAARGFTSALAHSTFPEKPSVQRLPREIQHERPHEYDLLARRINDLAIRLSEDYEAVLLAARDRLKISLLPMSAPKAASRPQETRGYEESPQVPPLSDALGVSVADKATPAVGRASTPLATMTRFDWRLAVSVMGILIALLGVLLAVFVVFFGNNLCAQQSPPAYLVPLIEFVCAAPRGGPPANGIAPAPTFSPLASRATASASPMPAARASILSPTEGSFVPEVITVTGQLTGLASGQAAFLVVRSAAFGRYFFCQGMIHADEQGFWSVEAIFKSPGYRYETMVVLADSPEAIGFLSDPFNRSSGFEILPPGASRVSPIVSVARE